MIRIPAVGQDAKRCRGIELCGATGSPRMQVSFEINVNGVCAILCIQNTFGFCLRIKMDSSSLKSHSGFPDQKASSCKKTDPVQYEHVLRQVGRSLQVNLAF
jgi:hypothetical protein